MNRCFYDSWSVIFDSHNKPLLGKLEFYEAKTTSLKTVYDVDGKELLNPIYVNGRPDTEIMLGEGDYSVKFFEYIGHGDMRNDADFNNWFDYKTIYLKDETVEADKTTNVPTVVTIDELKALKNMKDGDIVEVIGYFTVDDCPARQYVWHEESGRNDDGGIIIKSSETTQGYWEMKIPGTYVDVRWYGDIPSNFASGGSSNLSQRTKAAEAANYYHKDLYFPSYGKGNALGFYMFTGSNTVSVTKDIICDNGVRFVVKTGTTGTKIQCHELYKCDKYLFISESSSVTIGGYLLEADWIRTSWFNSSTTVAEGARVGYIIDKLFSGLKFSNCKIKIERDSIDQTGVSFDNCEMVECYKTINYAITMKNMEVIEDWFVDNYDFSSKLSISGCTILVDNFTSGNTYIRLKNKQSEYNYGDLMEKTLTNASIYASSNTLLENCTGSIQIIGANNGSVEMHNVSGSMTISRTGLKFNIVDCWLTIANTAAVSVNNMEFRRGSLSGSNGMVINSVAYFDNVDIGIYINTNSITGTWPKFVNCTINGGMETKPVIIDNCDINSTILTTNYVYGGQNIISFRLYGNKFVSGAGHYLSSTVANTIVAGQWVNNYSTLSSHFISIERANIDPYESHHPYIYLNNDGPNVIQQNPRWTDTLTGSSGTTGESGIMPFYNAKTFHLISGSQYGIPVPGWYLQGCYGWERVPGQLKYREGGLTDIDCYTTQFNMFTVGTLMDDKILTLRASAASVTPPSGGESDPGSDTQDTSAWLMECVLRTSQRAFYASQVGYVKNIMFYSGYTWRLMGVNLGYAYGLDYQAAGTGTSLQFVFEIDRHT